ncbi:MAG: uracil-DNA glycosylase [Nitriliruptorales bacterium]|nr:uracil-DNA glycosylase [Nitriliruptorales bacterium]
MDAIGGSVRSQADATEGPDLSTDTSTDTRERDFTRLVGPGWGGALEPVRDTIAGLGDFLRTEAQAGRRFLPSGDRVFAAFGMPLDEVKVLIVGQDPYPTPGHPIGLCFAVAPEVRPLPKSLQNIFREYQDDLGHPAPTTGDLTPWVEQGVMLLNRCLTVRAGQPASHRGKGWEEVTEAAIHALVDRGGPLVAILWGRDAQSLEPMLGDTPCITSPHPSPLSANRGFFGSRPFSRANELLVQQGGEPVDWRLP